LFVRRPIFGLARFSVVVVAGALGAGGCGFDGRSGSQSPPDALPPGPDGSIPDAALPDAPVVGPGPGCLGADRLPVCVDTPPTGSLTLSGTLDTDHGDPCLATQPASWAAQPAACFVMARSIAIDSLTVIGHRALVVFATSHLTVAAKLDVASHRSPLGAVATGPGSPSMECSGFSRDPVNGPGGGGGAGGSFMTLAGDGGTGDVTNHGGGLPHDPLVGAPGRLRGGCPGQVAAGGGVDDGGAAGGAVYLVSGGDIAIDGTINASGAGGAGGTADNGGSGGGSGGMIVLFASAITTTPASALIALGGGGGGGAASASAGVPATGAGANGSEPQLASPSAAAAGGSGGAYTGGGDGGDGGNGGSGFPATGANLDGVSGEDGAGGGGGGGGAGYIQSNQSLGPATVLPAAAIGS
jgi:hypothetical protein